MKKHNVEENSINNFFCMSKHGMTWMYEECDKELKGNGVVIFHNNYTKNSANALVVWLSGKLGFKVDWFYRESKAHYITLPENKENLIRFMNSVMDNTYTADVADTSIIEDFRSSKVTLHNDEVKESVDATHN